MRPGSPAGPRVPPLAGGRLLHRGFRMWPVGRPRRSVVEECILYVYPVFVCWSVAGNSPLTAALREAACAVTCVLASVTVCQFVTRNSWAHHSTPPLHSVGEFETIVVWNLSLYWNQVVCSRPSGGCGSGACAEVRITENVPVAHQY